MGCTGTLGSPGRDVAGWTGDESAAPVCADVEVVSRRASRETPSTVSPRSPPPKTHDSAANTRTTGCEQASTTSPTPEHKVANIPATNCEQASIASPLSSSDSEFNDALLEALSESSESLWTPWRTKARGRNVGLPPNLTSPLSSSDVELDRAPLEPFPKPPDDALTPSRTKYSHHRKAGIQAEFSADEDELLLLLKDERGWEWIAIEPRFPHKRAEQVRKRYHRLRARIIAAQRASARVTAPRF